MKNAGLRLWEAQKHQGTGLCIGLDPHYTPDGELNADFYMNFSGAQTDEMRTLFAGLGTPAKKSTDFLAGVASYFLSVIDAAWQTGIRVYKPQAAFYERFGSYGLVVLEILCRDLHERAEKSSEPIFLILDAKRGDIESTQLPYYDAYLSSSDREVFPGMTGRYGFDTMTVTTWLGADVLTPGLPFFRDGKGAIVVTRSSNPSGQELQELTIESGATANAVALILGRKPTAHEVMLHLTEQFSEKNGLNVDGVSPLFSVVGSTVKMTDSFRTLRPQGIALVPGFGAQGGTFDNVMPLYIQEGPLAGHVGILSSSREFSFPWMTKSGGAGDPKNLKGEMQRAVENFKSQEKEAYLKAGLVYPF